MQNDFINTITTIIFVGAIMLISDYVYYCYFNSKRINNNRKSINYIQYHKLLLRASGIYMK